MDKEYIEFKYFLEAQSPKFNELMSINRFLIPTSGTSSLFSILFR